MQIGPNLSDAELRSLAAQRIANGQLPVMLMNQVAGAYGAGERCDVCEQPIEGDQPAYEVNGPDRPAGRVVFHLICFKAWQHECTRLLADGDPPPATQSLVT